MDAVAQLTKSLAGRYDIDREIGRGGMATVYLAHDQKHHRSVALKVLNPELGALLGVERFLGEIQITANLQHPNLLPLFDSGEAGGLLYYVMPFIDGESLRARLDCEKQLPIDEAMRIAVAVASALSYAHARGVIHRDLKPENILLQSGQPMVADFGIAIAVNNAGGARLTQTGLSLGTPMYMSPEQATGDRIVDARADVYSLASMLYEMLAGDPPHIGSTTQAVIAKVLTERPRPIRQLRSNVPVNVEMALDKALEKLPADRFATADEFAAALTRINTAPIPASATVSVSTIRSTWRVLLPWAVAALATVAWGISSVRQPMSNSPIVVGSLLPPEGQDFSEAESFGALSPSGISFAFAALGPRGETSLWIQRLDTIAAQHIPRSDGATAPFWSPDEKRLGFFMGGQLFLADASGGSMQPVCPIAEAVAGSWGAGDIIAVASASGIVRVDVARGTCRLAIPRNSSMGSVRHPGMLPDGRHVLFSSSDLRVGDLETGEVITVGRDAFDATYVGDQLIVFARGSKEGGSRLWSQKFDPKALRFTGDPVLLSEGVRTGAGVAAYAVSRNTLLYLPGLGDRGVLLTDRSGRTLDTVLANGTWTHAWARSHHWIALAGDRFLRHDADTRTGSAFQVSTWGNVFAPSWSPGDSLIAFQACDTLGRCGRIAVGRLRSGADTAIMPLDTTRNLWPSSWSPDGRMLVYTRTRSYSMEQAEIWSYTFSTGTAAPLVSQQSSVLDGNISPDGKWLAYQSNESARWEVFVRSLDGSTPARPVSVNGGRTPRWRADGKELFFIAPNGELMSLDVSTGASFTNASPRVLFAAPGWSRQSFFDIGTPYDARMDGQVFSFRITPTVPTAILVQNWKSKFK